MGSMRDGILGADDLPREKLETPEWAPEVPFVYVRGIRGDERDKWDVSMMERNRDGIPVPKMNGKDVRARFCALVLVDEDGNQIFNSADVPLLSKKSAVVLQRIWHKGRELSGMLVTGETETGEINEDAEEGNPSEAEESSYSA